MSTPRVWEREKTKEDDGFLHDGAADRYRAGSYADTALNADNLQDEFYWALAMFHGTEGCRRYIKDVMRSTVCRLPKFFDPLISPEERELYRGDQKVILYHETNYFSEAESHNRKSKIDNAMALHSMVREIQEHERYDDNVAAALGYFMILSDAYASFDQEFWDGCGKLGEVVNKLQDVVVGNQNSDSWTCDTKVRIYKNAVWETMGTTKSYFTKACRILGEIINELNAVDDY